MRILGALTTAAVIFSAGSASAVRPFITDDARVVGDRAAQLESWVRLDRRGFEHWFVPAIGPVAPLEMTLGGVWGRRSGETGLSAPLIQFKALALPTEPGAIVPGLAIVSGAVGPYGVGRFHGTNWDTYDYLAVSSSLDKQDHFLLHANVGVFVARGNGVLKETVTWGVASQAHLAGGFYLLGELFSGDPYAARTGGAFQVGARYFVSRVVQVDCTTGAGLWGADVPVWGSVGLRLASDPFLF